MTDSADDHWWHISAMRVPRRRHEVVWNGRIFKAIAFKDPKTQLTRWATDDLGAEPQLLPPKGQERRWGMQPEAWRPVPGDDWPEKLPSAMLSPKARFVTEKLKFTLVEEATAADLAREMEHGREVARAYRGDDGEVDPKKQWWKDPYTIKYEPPGEVTEKMAEGRLMRAVAACDARAGLTLEARTAGTVLADLATAADQAFRQFDATSDGAVRFRALPQDIHDFCEAMRWFAMLNPPKSWAETRKPWTFNKMQKVLHYRALPVPLNWREIGDRIDRTRPRATALYEEAVAMACQIANAPDRSTAELEALRERNRAFKRGAA